MLQCMRDHQGESVATWETADRLQNSIIITKMPEVVSLLRNALDNKESQGVQIASEEHNHKIK